MESGKKYNKTKNWSSFMYVVHIQVHLCTLYTRLCYVRTFFTFYVHFWHVCVRGQAW